MPKNPYLVPKNQRFLPYDLFPEYPEFVATYQIENIKNHQIYSDKLKLCVVYLNHVELATEEDKENDIDLWANLFNAKTWKEVNPPYAIFYICIPWEQGGFYMLAQKNEYLQETVSGVRKLTEDEKIRQQCQAREDFEYWERIRRNHHEKELRERDEIIRQKNKALQQKEDALQQEKLRNQQNEAQLAAALARIAELEASGRQP